MMIIDESHKNDTYSAVRDVINPLNPKIIIKVSATPESEPTISDIRHNRAGFVEVDREDVIDAGLIKEEIISQTEEDLNVFDNIDHDYLLLDLAMEKRAELKAEWERVGKDINPCNHICKSKISACKIMVVQNCTAHPKFRRRK